MATGSEVEIAVAARNALEAQGVPTRVVSVPTMELFREQDAAYRASVLPAGTVRIAIEAGLRQPPGTGCCWRTRPRKKLGLHRHDRLWRLPRADAFTKSSASPPRRPSPRRCACWPDGPDPDGLDPRGAAIFRVTSSLASDPCAPYPRLMDPGVPHRHNRPMGKPRDDPAPANPDNLPPILAPAGNPPRARRRCGHCAFADGDRDLLDDGCDGEISGRKPSARPRSSGRASSTLLSWR